MNNLTKSDCIDIIIGKYKELGCLPKKSDFSEYEVMMIKSHLGPWPRALETAGVKPAKIKNKKSKNKVHEE